MAKNTITRRIALVGGEALLSQLKSLGAAGAAAFDQIQKAADRVKGPGAEFAARLSAVGTSLKTVGASLTSTGESAVRMGRQFSLVSAAAAGVVIGLGLIVKSGAASADEMEKNAEKTGLTIDAYAKLQFAAEQANVSQEQFQTGISQLSKNLKAAADGSGEASSKFAKLGVDITGASGKLRPVEDIFLDIVDKFSKMQDGAEKTATAMALFGRAGANLIPLLNQTSAETKKLFDQVDALGLGFTKEQAVIGDAFGDALNLTFRAIKALKDQIGLVFAPALTDALNAITDFIARNRVAIVGFFETIRDTLASLPPFIQNGLIALVVALTGLIVVVGPLILAFGLFLQAIGFIASTVGTIISAIGALGVAFTGLGAVLETIVATGAGIVAFLGSWAFAIAALIIAIAALAIIVVRNWTQIKAAILGAISGIIAGIGHWISEMSAAAQAVVSAFVSAIGKLVGLFGSIIGAASAAAEAIAAPFVNAFNAIRDAASSVFSDILSWIADVIAAATRAAQAITGVGSGGGDQNAPAKASGGLMNGPGTSTSDSIWARLSKGEFVMKARAVQKYGVGFMSRVNAMQAPRFAMGGLALASPSVAFAGSSSDPAQMESSPRNHIDLHIGGETFAMLADDEVASSIQRFSSGQRLTALGKQSPLKKK